LADACRSRACIGHTQAAGLGHPQPDERAEQDRRTQPRGQDVVQRPHQRVIARSVELAAPERLQDIPDPPGPDPLPKVNGTHVHPDCPHCDEDGQD
jgi:hypothetical protein